MAKTREVLKQNQNVHERNLDTEKERCYKSNIRELQQISKTWC